jgi:hypothetical protein
MHIGDGHHELEDMVNKIEGEGDEASGAVTIQHQILVFIIAPAVTIEGTRGQRVIARSSKLIARPLPTRQGVAIYTLGHKSQGVCVCVLMRDADRLSYHWCIAASSDCYLLVIHPALVECPHNIALL